METASHPVYEALRDFVFADCRLGSSKTVRATVLLRDGAVLNPVARVPEQLWRSSGHSINLPVNLSLAGRVLEEKSYALISDTVVGAPRYGYFHHDHAEIVRSIICLPILHGDVSVGVLSIDSRIPDFFQKRHIGQAQMLAGLIAYLLSPLAMNGRASPISTELGKALRKVREAYGKTQGELGDQVETSRIAVSRWEAGSQPPNHTLVRRWCEALQLLQAEARPLVETLDLSDKLLPLIQSDPELIHRISPAQFEQFIAERLDRMGYAVQLTGSTNRKDGGIDIVAVPRGLGVGRFLLAAQVKHHSKNRKSGSPDVRELLSWKGRHFQIGLVVTNTEFTRDAKWLAQNHSEFLRLRDFNDLKRWIAGQFDSDTEWREIPTEIEVAPGCRISIPRPQILKPNEVWLMQKLKTDGLT